MSDAIPLPARPSLEQYRKLAKDLLHAAKSAEPGAVRAWAVRLAERLARLLDMEVTRAVRDQIDREAQRLEHRWREAAKTPPTLAQAQFFVAREHGFASWPKFTKHLEALSLAASPVSHFEAAVDAIVAGDLPRLKKLLRAHPELVHARSSREHRSTLLHYVSANGVEDFRQKTAKNIVAITRLLLEAGADVNAESDAYGGRSTTLGLTATSCHPEHAGVQIALLELLIARGGIIDGPDSGSAVNACLHNGRGEAAAFLAQRGARLDLEGAAGVGRLDVVQSFFAEDGSLKPPATRKQMRDGFAWACEFGRTSVVDFLLRRGIDPGEKLNQYGETGLHWAAYEAQLETVKLLLEHGAPIDARDDNFGGTPLGWAIYAWGSGPQRAKHRPYYEVVARLVRAGATVDPSWYEDDEDRRSAAARVRSDPRMRAALRGKLPP